MTFKGGGVPTPLPELLGFVYITMCTYWDNDLTTKQIEPALFCNPCSWLHFLVWVFMFLCAGKSVAISSCWTFSILGCPCSWEHCWTFSRVTYRGHSKPFMAKVSSGFPTGSTLGVQGGKKPHRGILIKLGRGLSQVEQIELGRCREGEFRNCPQTPH